MEFFLQGLLEQAIEANKSYKDSLSGNAIQSMAPTLYARSIATIHINIGRQSGKTTAIINNAKSGDIVIVDNTKIRDYFLFKFKESGRRGGVELTKDQILMPSMLLDLELSEKPLTVWIDEPGLIFSKIDRSHMYEALASGEADQRFIMLGE